MLQAPVSDLLRQGITAARAGDRAKARILFRDATNAEPMNENAWLWYAGMAETPFEAMACLEHVLSINPKNERAKSGLKSARLNAGVAAAKANDRGLARELLLRTSEDDPNNETVWLWLSGVTEDPYEAVTYLQRVLQLNPNNERAKTGLDFYQEKIKQLEEQQAAWFCPVCLSKSPEPQAMCPCCKTILDISQHEAALRNSEIDKERVRVGLARLQASASSRDDYATHYYIGMAFLNLGKIDEALGHFYDARRHNPDDEGFAAQVVQIQEQWSSLPTPVPEVTPAPPVAKTPAVPEKPARKDPGFVMIVDDSPTIRKLVSMTLSRNGYQMMEAGDGHEALERMQTEGLPDLILLDIGMPGMDGFALCKILRAEPQTAKIPIVMLTGKDGFFNKIRGKMAGTNLYLTKPFQPEELVQIVQKNCGVPATVGV